MPQNYAGKKLRGRPFKLEDDLKGADFTGANLRGVNFKGLDLTAANFTNADIRSANFTDTTLKNADFTGAQAGLQKRWMWSQLIVIFLLSIFFNFASVFLTVALTIFLFTPQSIQKYTIFPGPMIIIIIATIFVAIARQGSTIKAAGTILATAAVAVANLVAVAVLFSVKGAVVAAFTFVMAVTVLVIVSFVFAFTVTVAGAAAVVITVTVTVIVAIIAVVAVARADVGIVLIFAAAAVAIAVFFFSLYIAWRTYKGDEKFALVRSLGIVLGAIGGTSFCGADLAAANFTGGKLKSAHFNNSKQQLTLLNQTCWKDAKQLDRARVGTSLLANPAVRRLLVTGNGYKKSYVDANLYGANLNGANLERANLKGANLSHATLQQAHLKDANLANTLATGADFTGAYLTGACLEDWNINHETILENVDCQFVFLLQEVNELGNRERRPSSGIFAPSEFTKLFVTTQA